MRFEVQKHTKRGIECLEKLGILHHENGTKNMTMTPACTLFASTGCIPYITSDLLKYIPNLPNMTEIPFTTMYLQLLTNNIN